MVFSAPSNCLVLGDRGNIGGDGNGNGPWCLSKGSVILNFNKFSNFIKFPFLTILI